MLKHSRWLDYLMFIEQFTLNDCVLSHPYACTRHTAKRIDVTIMQNLYRESAIMCEFDERSPIA